MSKLVGYILSDSNITKLTNKIAEHVNIDESPKAYQSCKRWLHGLMEKVISSQKNNLHGDAKEIVKKLNTLCIKHAVSIYRKREQANQNDEYSDDNVGNYKLNRDRELNGNKKVKLNKRPKSMSVSKRGNREKGGLMGAPDMGGGQYAPLTDGFDGIITADGRRQDSMFMGNQNDMLGFGDKKQIANELERRMMDRKGEYENIPGRGGISGL